MKLVAIMIVRNEEACLPRCLEHLNEQGLTAAVIDNGSTDRTREILASFSPHVVTRVDHAPFDGVFRWKDLLTQAHAMRQGLDADWVHVNSADEICNSDRSGERLVDAVARIASAGYTAINYDEFVFVPTTEQPHAEGVGFDHVIRDYYFYEPMPLRQMRTCKNVPDVSNVEAGAHRLSGQGIHLYPHNLPLRHYIALNAAQFKRKYENRRFPPDELVRGWHENRVNIAAAFRLPSPHRLKHLVGDDLSALDRSERWTRHFWELPDERP
jgi:glycosyltransferase involved in cell wall biosynthesis